ncbi:MAG: methyltransferase [Thermoplasmata archaeon]|nr:methyltransferase [Candidatus Sysuiplasma acidicola]
MVRIKGIEIDRWSDDTYFPSEDTELLLDALDSGEGSFIDVGTGTGIIGIRAAMLGYGVVSTDISTDCLHAASHNARMNGVVIQTVRCDLLTALTGRHDVIAFNPPYLPDAGYPDRLLTGGEKGYELALCLLSQAEDMLRENGRVMLVLSSLGGMSELLGTTGAAWSFRKLKQCKLEFETIAVVEARLTGRDRRAHSLFQKEGVS